MDASKISSSGEEVGVVVAGSDDDWSDINTDDDLHIDEEEETPSEIDSSQNESRANISGASTSTTIDAAAAAAKEDEGASTSGDISLQTTGQHQRDPSPAKSASSSKTGGSGRFRTWHKQSDTPTSSARKKSRKKAGVVGVEEAGPAAVEGFPREGPTPAMILPLTYLQTCWTPSPGPKETPSTSGWTRLPKR